MTESTQKSLYLGFAPVAKQGEAGAVLQIYLINYLTLSIEYELCQKWEAGEITFKESLEAEAAQSLNQIMLQDLETQPLFSFRIRVPRVEKTINKKLKIKPAALFKNPLKYLSLLDKELYLFNCTSDLQLQQSSRTSNSEPKEEQEQRNPAPQNITETDLQSLKQQWLRRDTTSNQYSTNRPPEVVDLHIEQLVESEKNMSNSEILSIQLNHMEKMLERAIACDYNKITFIHGVGTGILKQEIFTILEEHDQVKSFNNRYRPRFGFGATEVFF